MSIQPGHVHRAHKNVIDDTSCSMRTQYLRCCFWWSGWQLQTSSLEGQTRCRSTVWSLQVMAIVVKLTEHLPSAQLQEPSCERLRWARTIARNCYSITINTVAILQVGYWKGKKVLIQLRLKCTTEVVGDMPAPITLSRISSDMRKAQCICYCKAF